MKLDDYKGVGAVNSRIATTFLNAQQYGGAWACQSRCLKAKSHHANPTSTFDIHMKPGSLIERSTRAVGTAWHELESAPTLKHAECHIWSLSLRQPEERFARLEEILSLKEKQRADAFLLPAPRQQFVICRGALRVLLGAYLNREPRGFHFTQNPFGKPGLANSDIHFNVSHSGTLALIAITRDIDIGVDIELHRPLEDMSGLAHMVFDSQDMEHWSALPQNQRTSAFYRAWTRKEAVAKAIGCGLALDFPTLRVSFIAGQPPTILEMDPSRGRIHDWTLENIATDDDYSAALAASTRKLTIRQYTL
jgi:4'-phosphopantetheinyl transferase